MKVGTLTYDDLADATFLVEQLIPLYSFRESA